MSDPAIDALLQDIVGGGDFNSSIDNYIQNILYPSSEAPRTQTSSVDRASGHPSRTSQGGNFTPDSEGYINGRAATFATASDLRNYAQTGSLATGDNGRGAWGANTAVLPGVAISRSVLKAVYGSEDAAKHRLVEVISPNGTKANLPILDKGPAIGRAANNAVLELTPAATRILGSGDANGYRYKFLQ